MHTATTVDEVVAGIEQDGYAIVEDALSPAEVVEARTEMRRVLDATPYGRNDFEGFGTKRVYALFAKTRVWDGQATSPLVLGVLDRVLGSSYQLSAPTGIEIGPGEKAQILHHDDSIYPLPVPHDEVVLNTMWPLDDFTEENGATRIVPGSHRSATPPPAGVETVAAEMRAGSVMFYTGSVWHGGGANRTDGARLGVILEYVVGWLRPQENHLLAVPRHVAATLPDRLQELLGYNIHPPFVGYVDGRHPRRVLEEASGER
ncbi:MAG TPA: phytanoyl-CoA dioxygenase family protein [Acidimicrobiales bacterium]